MIIARSSLRLTLRHLIQIHEHGNKRCLSVTGHQCNQLILNRLDSVLYLFFQAVLRYLTDNLLIQWFACLLALLNDAFA